MFLMKGYIWMINFFIHQSKTCHFYSHGNCSNIFYWTVIKKCNRWSIHMPWKSTQSQGIIQYLKPRISFVLSVMRIDIFKMLVIHPSSSICKFPFTKMINKYQRVSLWSRPELVSAFCLTQWGGCQKVQNYWGKVLATHTSTFICFLCLNVCYSRSQPVSNFYSTVKSGQRKARSKISIYCMLII